MRDTTTHKAVQRSTGRTVAVKLLLRQEASASSMLALDANGAAIGRARARARPDAGY